MPLVLLEAVVLVDGVELATLGIGCAASAVGGPWLGTVSPVGDGWASLLAAQASEATSVKVRITPDDEYLLNKIRLIN